MKRVFDGVKGKILKSQITDALKYWVFIPAAVLSGGNIADRLFYFPEVPAHYLLTLTGVLLIMFGVVFIQISTRDLATYGDGTPNPLRPPKRLVSDGSYSLCRHPMFFGYDLAALGVILLFRSWGMLLVSFPIFIFLEYRFLRNEETKMAKRFGESYTSYKQDVPFLVPVYKRRGRV